MSKLHEKPSLSKENIQHVKKWNLLTFFLCLSIIFALLDPDPNTGTPLNQNPQHCFLFVFAAGIKKSNFLNAHSEVKINRFLPPTKKMKSRDTVPLAPRTLPASSLAPAPSPSWLCQSRCPRQQLLLFADVCSARWRRSPPPLWSLSRRGRRRGVCEFCFDSPGSCSSTCSCAIIVHAKLCWHIRIL